MGRAIDGGDGYRRAVTEDGAEVARERRRAGLVAALADAVRTGGTTASVDDLARLAGVPKSVLYNHFADRAGVLSAVADGAVEQWCERPPARPSPGSAGADARAVVEAFVALAETEPELFDLVRSGPGGRRSSDRIERIGARIVAAVVPGRTGDGTAIAAAVGGAVVTAADRWAQRGATDRAALVDELVAFLQDGLAPRPDASLA